MKSAESIIGGYVYRGQRYRSQIGGTYVFSDYLTRRVWLYRPGGGRVLQPARLGTGSGPTSFGVDDRRRDLRRDHRWRSLEDAGRALIIQAKSEVEASTVSTHDRRSGI